jgi:hypothetical protein
MPNFISNPTAAEKIDTQIYNGIGHSVFKFYYGEKYVIGMGSYLMGAINMIIGDIGRKARGKKSASGESRLFLIFSDYVNLNPGQQFKIEILFQNESAYQILKRCQEELDDAIADANCLNSFFYPFVSKRVQTPKLYWNKMMIRRVDLRYWINRGHYLNYRKWLYSRNVI